MYKIINSFKFQYSVFPILALYNIVKDWTSRNKIVLWFTSFLQGRCDFWIMKTQLAISRNNMFSKRRKFYNALPTLYSDHFYVSYLMFQTCVSQNYLRYTKIHIFLKFCTSPFHQIEIRQCINSCCCLSNNGHLRLFEPCIKKYFIKAKINGSIEESFKWPIKS